MTAPLELTAFENRLFADLPEGEVTEALKSRGLPSRRAEAWKWSDLRGALREEKAPSSAYQASPPVCPLMLDGASVLTIKNGAHDGAGGLGQGLFLKEGTAEPALVPDADLASLATAAKTIEIEAQGEADPLIVRRLSDAEGRHADRLRLHLAEGASLTLIETHEAQGAPFANSLTEIALEKGARLTRIVVQTSADEAVIVHTTLVALAPGADIVQTTVTGGAALARHETRLAHQGESHARLDGLYTLSGARHVDITTHVDHRGEGAQTEELVKGIARGRTRGVFQGKFHVAPGAQRTDAKMAHHALLLSKDALVNAKPELEIYADDVECAHGNTAGALDAEALFYMRQRGLSEEEAQGLLIDAFAGEVLARVEDEALREQLETLFRSSA